MNVRTAILSISAVGLLVPVGGALAEAPITPAGSVQAQWQASELRFHFMGLGTYYNCTSIEDRLEHLLRDLGARADVRVDASGCSPGELSDMISARIRLNMPVGTGSEGAISGEPFAAHRKLVTLSIRNDRSAGSGDCELLQQVRDQLFPALKLQVVQDDVHCFPGETVLGNRSMQVAALVPVDSRAAR